MIALFGALVAITVSGGSDAAAHGNTGHYGQPSMPDHGVAAISKNELALRQDMRKLWEDHVIWTRLAVISLRTDSPDTQATVGRLLKNQTDIGNAIKP
jgi:hypothetical protein